ncbi:putative ribonuclease H-like domain-containing protein [Tanacetum coccineum]
MDVKSAFLYGQIEEEVYGCQPAGFEDPDKVYKVVKALYGLHQAPRAWYETLAKYLLDNGFHKGKIYQTLFIKKQKRDILLVQMSSMGELTFFLDVRTASTPMDTEKPLLKDSDGDDVDVHIYRSMIGSLMYLTSSRPDIMFAVYSLAYYDSDYARASLDRKSTTGGCQFLGCKLISWQCKKQTMVATSSTEAEYVAATSFCRQMANLSEDIQCASSDTQPPMLDKTDFASWQQRIRLYCRGTEGALHLGLERPRVYSDLSPEDKERYNADIQATNILLQGLPKDIYTLINHYTDAKDI